MMLLWVIIPNPSNTTKTMSKYGIWVKNSSKLELMGKSFILPKEQG